LPLCFAMFLGILAIKSFNKSLQPTQKPRG